jgi:gluconolactonase
MRHFIRPRVVTGTRRSLLVAGAGLAAGCATTAVGLGAVRRENAGMDAIVAPDAVVQKLAEGFTWAEGPVWDRANRRLLFTDVPGNVMHSWSRERGLEEFMRPSGFAGSDASHLREAGANGLAIDAAGALVMCDSGSRALARVDLGTRQKTIFLERYEGKRFNSPNDLTLSRSGAIYFTDPPYGLAGINESPVKELAFNGVFRLSPDGALRLIDDSLTFPNGVALSPDESTLYVANSDPARPIIKSYALDASGLPASSSVFFDASSLMGPDAPGLPDGMAVDAEGRLFATGPGGVMVLSPAGVLMGVIGAGRAVANCEFGEDGRTLFLTAHDTLGRIRLKARGLGWA